MRIGNAARRAAPARRLRRGDGLRCTRRARAGLARHDAGLGAAARAARAPREGLGAARRGHLGSARRAAPLHPLQGHGLGGFRPRREDGRALRHRRAGRATGASSARASTPRSAARASIRERGSFVQSYGSEELDASLLLIPLTGFLPAERPARRSDHRCHRSASSRSTAWCCATCTHESHRRPAAGRGRVPRLQLLARRHPVHAGPPREARALFERLAGLAQRRRPARRAVRPAAQRFLGNFPQAFSHVGLVNTALNLSQPREAGRAARGKESGVVKWGQTPFFSFGTTS